MRNVFGWDLPPGCTQRHIDEAFGYDAPCAVCGQLSDDCICPECPVCGNCGDPSCYLHGEALSGLPTYDPPHGLVPSLAQVCLKAESDLIIEQDNARMDAYYEEKYDLSREGG